MLHWTNLATMMQIFLFIETKYVKVRHFVATNCCFVNLSQKKKTNKSTNKYGRMNTVFDLLQKQNISS